MCAGQICDSAMDLALLVTAFVTGYFGAGTMSDLSTLDWVLLVAVFLTGFFGWTWVLVRGLRAERALWTNQEVREEVELEIARRASVHLLNGGPRCGYYARVALRFLLVACATALAWLLGFWLFEVFAALEEWGTHK